jgi:predicted ATPase
MITQLQIKNFKSVINSGLIQLKPITILVGPNSSGKSSLLKSLLLLKQTVESSDNSSPLVPNGSLVNLGSYANFINNKDNRKKLEFEVKFRNTFDNEEEVNGRFEFNYYEDKAQIVLTKSEIEASGYIQKIWKTYKKAKFYSLLFFEKKDKGETKVFNGIIPIKFFDFGIPQQNFKKFKESKIVPVYPFNFIITEIFNKIYYIGPLRKNPQRYYFPSGDAPQDVGKRGERAIDALWYAQKNSKNSNENLETIIRDWFKKFNFSSNFKLELLEEVHSIYEILIGNTEDECNFNMSDVGFGVSQTLPIIIECFYAPRNSILLIEQPEIHLHPKAQATLGDLFIDSAIDGSRQLIIETHSEHLLSRIRRRIAEGTKITSEDVCILFFEKRENETQIKEIKLDESGRYTEYLSGFFEEEYEESIEHLKAISKKMNHD